MAHQYIFDDNRWSGYVTPQFQFTSIYIKKISVSMSI